jgi:putative ABC transport system permease protein
MQRAGDISLRRALGAPVPAIFLQCLVEAAAVGIVGAATGLTLTTLGLAGLRALLTRDIGSLAHLNVADVAITVAMAVAATLLAGIYPAWRATRLQPAWQLPSR